MNGQSDGNPIKSDNKRKKIIIGAIAAVLIIALIGSACFIIVNAGKKEPCLTIECVKSSNEISSFIDKNADPCTDFYQFACGNYLQENPKLRGNTPKSDNYLNMERKMLSILEEPPKYLDKHSTKIIKTFFNACLNESALDSVDLKRIKWLLYQAGGWPVLENGWSEPKFDWTKTTQKLRSLGAHYDVFLQISHRRRQDDGTKRAISIKNRRFFAYENRKMQHEFMVDIAVMMGARKVIAERDFNQVLNFYGKLVEATNYTMDESVYTPRTIREIRLMYPSISLEFLSNILYPLEVSQDEVITLEDPNLLPRVLNVINDTPKRTVANFILWYNVQQYIYMLPKKFRERQNKYQSIINGQPIEPRSEICLEFVKSSSSPALVVPYFRKYYPDEVKRSIRDILNNVKDEYKNVVDDLSWLDEDGKKVVKDKLAGSEDYVTIDEFMHINKLEKIYDEVSVNESDLLDSLLKLNLAYYKYQFSLPYEPIEYIPYDPKRNKIILEPHDTQGIFFEKGRPQYLNYGGMGSEIAYHISEILFEGKNYDMQGNLRQWSTSESLIEYDEKQNCLALQYRNIFIHELQGYVNAATKKKDLADLIAKYIAYKAYEKWSDEHGNEAILPGLTYTPKQLFWINSALIHCNRLDADGTRSIMNSEGLSPSRLRVNGPLRNLQEFARDFNCSPESKMNPPTKCKI